MKKSVIILVVLCAVFLSGCAGYREIDSEYLISAIGFDTDDSNFRVYAEVRSIKDTDKESDSKVFDAVGKTPYSAVNNIAALLPKKAVLDHCGTAIISDKIADKNFKSVIDYLYDAKNLNLGIYLYSASDIKKILFCDSQAISVGYDIMAIQDNMEKTSGIKFRNKYYEVVSRKTASGGFCLPVISVKDDRPEISGQTVYEGYKPVITLSKQETVLYNLLFSGSTGGEICISGKRCRVNKITARIEEESGTLTANIRCIYRYKKDRLNSEMKSEVKKLIENLKNTAALKALGIEYYSNTDKVKVTINDK